MKNGFFTIIAKKISWSKRNEPAQSKSKTDIHQKKVMLSVWRDFKGIVYFELLPRNQTINSNVYCPQLMKLVTRKKLLELDWEVTPHPPYSPDLAPSDHQLFRSLQNHLNGKTFDLNEAVKNELIQFFVSRNHTFYESEILKLKYGNRSSNKMVNT